MKRGKEDEKVMGPMFPRLHVNDTEKGGPRAPPRNKMALYEQLSIPSQRYNNPNNRNNNTSSAASSTQGSDEKRPIFSPHHLPRINTQVDNSNAISSDFNTSLAAPQKKLDEGDFTVPVFVQSENNQNNKNTTNSMHRENVYPSRAAQPNRSSRDQITSSKEQKQTNTKVSDLRQKNRSKTQSLQCQEEREDLTSSVDRLQNTTYALRHEVTEGSQLQSVENANSNGEYQNDNTGYSLGIEKEDQCDDDSDTSMVDSVSAVYITPDDVVGVIGQKHFWKARRAIVNQQRVFAVQVFELHRLIKVQKLFAGSPNLALDGASFPEKTLKTSIPEQVSLEFVIKPPTNIESQKENNLNNQKTEASAENAVAKSSISSSQNISHHQPPLPSNPQPTPVTTEPNTNPWHPNQPGGQHWLVPIMSPTEGLIYKPYPGPAYAGSNPTINNFPNYNNPYGITPNNSHPPFQVPPGFPLMSHHGYFMPYAMSAPMGPTFSGSEVDQGNNHFNGPTQKRKSDDTDFGNTIMSEERELQVSTWSSPRGEGNRPRFFQNSPCGDDVARDNRTRVIKVVPHNAMSANETAFRIFQSIQREREQNESL